MDFIEMYLKENNLFKECEIKTYKKKEKVKKEEKVIKYSTETTSKSYGGFTLADMLFQKVNKDGKVILTSCGK